jgi:hypothetical protein
VSIQIDAPTAVWELFCVNPFGVKAFCLSRAASGTH